MASLLTTTLTWLVSKRVHFTRQLGSLDVIIRWSFLRLGLALYGSHGQRGEWRIEGSDENEGV
jgi:hypothetical protein